MDTSRVGKMDDFTLNPVGCGYPSQTSVAFCIPRFEGCGKIPFQDETPPAPG